MRIIFMGTPDFAAVSLRAITGAGYEVALVVTQPDKPKGRGGRVQMSDVKQCAMQSGLTVFQPERVKAPEAVAELKKYDPDIIVVAAFGQILSKEILELPGYGCINVHASLLPRLRGASPIQTAILEGDEVTGVTIQQMNEGVDTGDILAQREVRIEPFDTGGSLFDKLASVGAELVADTLGRIERGEVTPVPQDESKATHAKLMDKSLGRIDWSRDAAQTERKIRALDPWPSAFTGMEGRTLKIWKASVSEAEAPSGGSKPGEIISVSSDKMVVACGRGALVIEELQLEGKKRMSTHDFLLGNKVQPGLVLGS